MNSKYTIIVTTVALIVALITILWLMKPNAANGTVGADQPNKTPLPQQIEGLQTQSMNHPADPKELLKNIFLRRSLVRLDHHKIEESLNKTRILQLADPQKVINGLGFLSKRQQTDGRTFIEYDPYVIESKFVGDSVDIYIPAIGQTVQGKITNVEINGDIIRWDGNFENFNSTQNKFSISQTMIDNYALGTFETPMGSFNMEAKNGLGWIVNQKSDFVLPANGKDYAEAHPAQH